MAWDFSTEPEFDAKLASVLRELEAELRGGKEAPGHAYTTFEALGSMRQYARPSVPAIIAAIGAWAPSTVRKANDELHDVTTSIETDIPETATRVFVVYKLNTGYARGFDDFGSGLDSRFDLQVNQALPVSVAGTKWELLVGLRNLFRDPAEAGSVYDELLVVRPPTRVVGGVLVKF